MKDENYSKVYDKGPKELLKESRSAIIFGVIYITVVSFFVYIGFDDNQMLEIMLFIFLFGGIGLMLIIGGIRKAKESKSIRIIDSEIAKASLKLEEFKSMKLDREEIDDYFDVSLAEYFKDNPVTLKNSELKDILLRVKHETISVPMFYKWVESMWFSEFYEFSNTVSEILYGLYTLYQNGERVTENQINSYMNKL